MTEMIDVEVPAYEHGLLIANWPPTSEISLQVNFIDWQLPYFDTLLSAALLHLLYLDTVTHLELQLTLEPTSR